MKNNKVRILTIDIETSPIISYTWGIFDQNIGLNQIIQDWHLLSFAAKFKDEKKLHYKDQRNAKDITNDKPLLEEIWKLLDKADIVIGQNVKSFDIKKINARFITHGMKPPSSYKQIDTLLIARRKFGMTSNKLEHLSKVLCKKKKSAHKKFAGFELWKECLKGNKAAWREMEMYNKADVEATEELYLKLQPFDNSFNPNLYTDTLNTVCACGSKNFVRNGHTYTSTGKFQRLTCKSCGAEVRSKANLLSKEKRKSLKGTV